PITPDVEGDLVRYSFADLNTSNTFRLFPANAYRFDLLNTLRTPAGQPLLKFPGGTEVTIYDTEIDANGSINAFMHVLKRASGEVDVKVDPIYVETTAATPAPLPANGVAVDGRYYLQEGLDYSPIATSPTTFLVPSSGPGTASLRDAMNIENYV